MPLYIIYISYGSCLAKLLKQHEDRIRGDRIVLLAYPFDPDRIFRGIGSAVTPAAVLAKPLFAAN